MKGPDRGRYFQISSGSARECAAILDILLRCEIIDSDEHREGKQLVIRLVALSRKPWVRVLETVDMIGILECAGRAERPARSATALQAGDGAFPGGGADPSAQAPYHGALRVQGKAVSTLRFATAVQKRCQSVCYNEGSYSHPRFSGKSHLNFPFGSFSTYLERFGIIGLRNCLIWKISPYRTPQWDAFLIESLICYATNPLPLHRHRSRGSLDPALG